MNKLRYFCKLIIYTYFFIISSNTYSQTKPLKNFITIGTGGVTGVYYPAGGAICRLVNRERSKTGIHCSVESTAGSVYNLNAMRNKDLDFSIVQTDAQYNALHGLSNFKPSGANSHLRAVFSLHSESLTIVARKSSHIYSLEDLKGKRFDISSPGSGTNNTMKRLISASNIKLSDFALISNLKSSEQAKALCDNKIDAFVFTVGHPSGAFKEASTSCDTNLVNVTGPAVKKLLKESPYYQVSIIPGGMYRGSPKDTTTIGVAASVVTSDNVSEETVYNITKAVFTHLPVFKKMHSAFSQLDAHQMANKGFVAPLHQGAKRYYKEAGLLNN